MSPRQNCRMDRGRGMSGEEPRAVAKARQKQQSFLTTADFYDGGRGQLTPLTDIRIARARYRYASPSAGRQPSPGAEHCWLCVKSSWSGR